jgi:hypothetical protein
MFVASYPREGGIAEAWIIATSLQSPCRRLEHAEAHHYYTYQQG